MSEGDIVSLDRVLLISNGEKLTIGNPTIDGAKVFATVKEQIKDKKVIVFKYKPKVRYRKKTGHRQLLTRLAIDKIDQPGIDTELPKKSKRRKKEVIKDGA